MRNIVLIKYTTSISNPTAEPFFLRVAKSPIIVSICCIIQTKSGYSLWMSVSNLNITA
jgi:hypothetical protein